MSLVPQPMRRPWWWGVWRRRLFGIKPSDIDLDRLGFARGAPGVRERIEEICGAFVVGYHAALEVRSATQLEPDLDHVPPRSRGFAYEGAAMGLAMLDAVTPWRGQRVVRFLRAGGAAHAYMVHVGVGWALARLPVRLEKVLSRFDPLLRWLIVDGYGFHEAFFHWRDRVKGQPAPRRLAGYARHAFDQGVGRCLWFVYGGGVRDMAESIARVDPERHNDLWSGVGLAGAYAGLIEDVAELECLFAAAGSHRPALAQGAAFAAKARLRADNLERSTEIASQVFCRMPPAEAAAITDSALADLPQGADRPAYETWRCRVQAHFRRRFEPPARS